MSGLVLGWGHLSSCPKPGWILRLSTYDRATIGDGNALAVEVKLFRHSSTARRPGRPSTNAHHARLTSPSNTAVSLWPLADPLLD